MAFDFSMKVMLIDTVHPILEEMLNQAEIHVDSFIDQSKEQIEGSIKHYDGLVIRSRFPIDENFLNKAERLKCIGRSGSGLENIDIKYCESNDIHCLNVPEANANAVAEHVIGLLIALMRKVREGDSQVRENTWLREENRGHEISGKTLGIIGFGNTGQRLAQKLIGWNCQILAYDKYNAGFGTNDVTEVNLDELKSRADIISFHVPYNKETHHYFNEAFLEETQNQVYLLNTSRGGIVKTQALLGGLKSGKILGAALDVLEVE